MVKSNNPQGMTIHDNTIGPTMILTINNYKPYDMRPNVYVIWDNVK